MSGLFSILEKIKTKPGMYLGRASVSDLFMFLVGYESARSELGIDLTEEEEIFYTKFQPWLQEKLKITTNSSWAKIIMLNCHDENTGFQRLENKSLDDIFREIEQFRETDLSQYEEIIE